MLAIFRAGRSGEAWAGLGWVGLGRKTCKHYCAAKGAVLTRYKVSWSDILLYSHNLCHPPGYAKLNKYKKGGS